MSVCIGDFAALFAVGVAEISGGEQADVMFGVERVVVLQVSSERGKSVKALMFSTSRAAEGKVRRGSGSTRLTVLHKQSGVTCAHFLLHDTDHLSTTAT